MGQRIDLAGDRMALNKVMEFDHIIEVYPDGTVGHPQGVYAPNVHVDLDEDGQAHEEPYPDDTSWSLLSGWTGQYGYHGAQMHSSEFIGGALAAHILETPGLWVAVTVSPTDDSEPDGWALAYRAEV